MTAQRAAPPHAGKSRRSRESQRRGSTRARWPLPQMPLTRPQRNRRRRGCRRRCSRRWKRSCARPSLATANTSLRAPRRSTPGPAPTGTREAATGPSAISTAPTRKSRFALGFALGLQSRGWVWILVASRCQARDSSIILHDLRLHPTFLHSRCRPSSQPRRRPVQPSPKTRFSPPLRMAASARPSISTPRQRQYRRPRRRTAAG
mmetsp:Transcript_42320/g.132627  ORF Transcript_42320/g.132627 Transcript_42320/m.132627 type:complete len:205 (-) Transcript_42320:70-684(-)